MDMRGRLLLTTCDFFLLLATSSYCFMVLCRLHLIYEHFFSLELLLTIHFRPRSRAEVCAWGKIRSLCFLSLMRKKSEMFFMKMLKEKQKKKKEKILFYFFDEHLFSSFSHISHTRRARFVL